MLCKREACRSNIKGLVEGCSGAFDHLSLVELGVTAVNRTCDAMRKPCFDSFEASRVSTFKIFYKEKYWFAKKN